MESRNEYEWGDRSHTKSLLVVDPGLNNCGWAFWDTWPKATHMRGPRVIFADEPPTDTGLITPPRNAPLGDRMAHVAKALTAHRDLEYITLVVELPVYQEGASRQMGWKTGDLQKLVLLVGYLVADDWGAVALIPPREWKGQLPKSVVINRIIDRLGERPTSRYRKDTWDAVGLGLYYLSGEI